MGKRREMHPARFEPVINRARDFNKFQNLEISFFSVTKEKSSVTETSFIGIVFFFVAKKPDFLTAVRRRKSTLWKPGTDFSLSFQKKTKKKKLLLTIPRIFVAIQDGSDS